MEIFTSVPGSPRRFLTASCRLIFSVLLPSILMMRSPDRMPALKPGLSSMGATTVMKLSFMEITMPRPPKAPCVSFCSSLYFSGSMNSLCGSSVLSMPLRAP